MALIAAQKASRARAVVWLALGAIMAAANVIGAIQTSGIGYLVGALGWLALGAAQSYRSLFNTPVSAANAKETARAHYRLAQFVALFAFLTIIVGIAIQWA
jgi:hypothetical protein